MPHLNLYNLLPFGWARYKNLAHPKARKGYFNLAPQSQKGPLKPLSTNVKRVKTKNYLSIFLWYLQLLCIAFKRLKGRMFILTLLTYRRSSIL